MQNGQTADDQTLRTARRFPEGKNFAADSGAGVRIVAGKLSHGVGEFGLGLLARGAGLQHTDQRKGAAGAVVEVADSAEQRRRHGGRGPQLELQRDQCSLEFFGSHADDGQVALVDAKRLSQGGWRATKARLPIVVRNHNDGLGAEALGFLGPNKSTDSGFQSQRGKEIAGDELAVGALGLAGRAHVEGHHL